MSVSYRLCCAETRQSIWVGQGSPDMRVFYSGDPDIMEKLGRFLSATIGKPLVLLSDHETCELDYEEFE